MLFRGISVVTCNGDETQSWTVGDEKRVQGWG